MRPTDGIIPLEILTISHSVHLNLFIHRISRKQYGIRLGLFLEIYSQFTQSSFYLCRVFSLFFLYSEEYLFFLSQHFNNRYKLFWTLPRTVPK